jgi:hypothetical protein
VPSGWERTDLWTRAAAIPGVHALSDARGAEAARFGAIASGQTMLYSASGELLFRGGITVSRGHSGDNAGRSAIVALLHQESPVQTATPVFGCSIVNGSSPRRRLPGVLAVIEQVLARIGAPVQSAQ